MTCSSGRGHCGTSLPRVWCWGRSWGKGALDRCTKVGMLVLLVLVLVVLVLLCDMCTLLFAF